MSEQVIVDRSTGEKRAIENIHIPDLWNVGVTLKGFNHKHWTKELCEQIGNDILEVWQTAHTLKRHIQENQ